MRIFFRLHLGLCLALFALLQMAAHGAPEPEVEYGAMNDYVLLQARHEVLIDVLANDEYVQGAWGPQITITKYPDFGWVGGDRPDGMVSYQPAPWFTGWDSFSYSFTDAKYHRGSATVYIQNNLRWSAGTYYTLVGDSETSFEATGTVTLTLSSVGVFTGAVQLGRDRAAVVGRLWEDCRGYARVRLGGKLVELYVWHNPSENRFYGALLYDKEERYFVADRIVPTGGKTVFFGGKYTFILPPVETTPAAEGVGFGYYQVDSRGLVRILGKDGTGRAFSAVSGLGPDDFIPFYAMLGARRTDSLHGWIHMGTQEGLSNSDGELGLSHALTSPATAGAVAPAPQMLYFIGSRYVAPKRGAQVLALKATAENTELAFGRGDDQLLESIRCTLGVGLTSTSSQLTRLRLDTVNGLFYGTVLLAGRWTPFSGALLQISKGGGGVLGTGATSAWVGLRVPEPVAVEAMRGTP